MSDAIGPRLKTRAPCTIVCSRPWNLLRLTGVMGVKILCSLHKLKWLTTYIFVTVWWRYFLATAQTAVQYLKYRLREKIDLITFPLRGKDMIRQAYLQSNGEAFQLLTPESRITLVSSPEDIQDISTAPNEYLSLHAAAKDILKPEYTMAGFNWHDQRGIEGVGFVRTLRTLLTNHLSEMTPGVRGILERGLAEEVGKSRSVNALALCKRIVTDMSGYAFFGRDIMEDEDFMNAAYYYNEDVLYGAELLRLTPKFLVPVVGALMPLWLTRQRTFFNGLVELIESRLQSSSMEKHNDVIQWIIQTAPKDRKWSAGRMAFEVMAIWFGSVQGLATTLTFAVYNLCEHSEYIEPLREEVQGPEGSKFLAQGDGLPLMDSFLKECSRWTPVESVTARRCALQDFAFTNGTKVKKGDWVAAALGPMLRDSSLYPRPDEFDGFRFADPSHVKRAAVVQPEGPSRFTDISKKWQVWGTGKITCPGRFFVSYVMKHVIFYILENYELSMKNAGAKHTLTWRTLTLPRPGVKVSLTQRV